MRRAVALALVLAVVRAAGGARAPTTPRARRGSVEQRRGRRFRGNVEYDGRLVFVRMRYDIGVRRRRLRRFAAAAAASRRGRTTIRRRTSHLMKILQGADGRRCRASTVERPDARRPGALRLSDRLHVGARATGRCRTRRRRGCATYLQKGGFIIFDDFRDNHWYNLEEQMKRVLPDARWVPLDAEATRSSTRSSRSRTSTSAYYGRRRPVLRHVRGQRSEQAAPGDRRHNQDLGEFWEFSDHGHDAGRSVERGVQVRRELFYLWIDSLTRAQVRLSGSARLQSLSPLS